MSADVGIDILGSKLVMGGFANIQLMTCTSISDLKKSVYTMHLTCYTIICFLPSTDHCCADSNINNLPYLRSTKDYDARVDQQKIFLLNHSPFPA